MHPKVIAMRRILVAAVCILATATPLTADDSLTAARTLLMTGKYAEAVEAYGALLPTAPIEACRGLAHAQAATGEVDQALQTLADGLQQHPHAAVLHAESARCALERGDRTKAAEAASAALKIDNDQVLARWVQADLHCTAGRLDEANAGYKWFVDYYNAHDVRDAETLCWIGLGAAQYGRWNRLPDQFGFLVNEIYPDALRADAECWMAHYQAGLLFLEKYNQAQAARSFKSALLINPNAACVFGALAQLAVMNLDAGAARQAAHRALEINPRDLSAQVAQGDILLTNFDAAAAIPVFAAAIKMHPGSELARGRLAGAYAVVDGFRNDAPPERTQKLIDDARAENPHCGVFSSALAAALDQSRLYPDAARFYRAATEQMPQLIEPYGELGVVSMRLGDEVAAQRELDHAFQIDPFNVRVKNMLEVLDVLAGYATIETEHFVIRFDRGADEILAHYAAEYLEQDVYPELVARFGFRPEGKSLFEIFSRARNTSGHGWFSARMVGLPFVHTVGACAGKIVALASPNDMPKKYNWARVLKHEFVHVLNLQQTSFSIPHWFTEALAVGSEGPGRPAVWNELLAERVPKNRLFNLDTINLGFVRPESALDWQMAYCQADLYARYITERYGDKALARMLAAYGDHLDTAGVLQREFAVEVADFERGYLDFVRQRTAELKLQPPARTQSFADMEKAHQDQPADAQATIALANACLARKDYPRARRLASAVVAERSVAQQAAYVLARVHLVAGESQAAVDVLEKHLDRAVPDENLLNLLAALKLKSAAYDAAAELYTQGATHNPSSGTWPRALAKVYLAQGNDAKLTPILIRLAELDSEDLPVRKKLAQLALRASDFPDAIRWGREALYIDVMDPDIHRLLAEAHHGNNAPRAAADEYAMAVKLAPGDMTLLLAFAETCIATDQFERARQPLAAILEKTPDHVQALELMEKLPR